MSVSDPGPPCASTISARNLSCTEGFLARRLRMRDSAFDVVSMPARMKVLMIQENQARPG